MSTTSRSEIAVSYTVTSTIIDSRSLVIAVYKAGLRKANVGRYRFKVIAFKASGYSFKTPSS